MLYRVLKPMLGDRPYKVGDLRELSPVAALHLVRAGALEEVKAAPEPKNKLARAPRNKAKG